MTTVDQVQFSADNIENMARAVIASRADVPFIHVSEDGSTILAYWMIDETGFHAFDQERGYRFGEIAMAIGKEPQTRTFLAMVVAEMVERGRLGPLETGFLIKVLRAAVAGSMN